MSNKILFVNEEMKKENNLSLLAHPELVISYFVKKIIPKKQLAPTSSKKEYPLGLIPIAHCTGTYILQVLLKQILK